jgi:hypothetical protein
MIDRATIRAPAKAAVVVRRFAMLRRQARAARWEFPLSADIRSVFVRFDVIRYRVALPPMHFPGATHPERADFDAPFRVRYPAIENLAILRATSLKAGDGASQA